MTIKELIEWAKKHDCLDCEVCVQYRDEGGLYRGMDYYIEPVLKVDGSKKRVVLQKEVEND